MVLTFDGRKDLVTKVALPNLARVSLGTALWNLGPPELDSLLDVRNHGALSTPDVGTILGKRIIVQEPSRIHDSAHLEPSRPDNLGDAVNVYQDPGSAGTATRQVQFIVE